MKENFKNAIGFVLGIYAANAIVGLITGFLKQKTEEAKSKEETK